jgi:phytoene desaturase
MACGGQLSRVVNAGIGGNTLAQMDARFVTDLQPFAPDEIWISGGLNSTELTAANKAAWASMVAKARNMSARPVIFAINPRTASPVTRVDTMNNWLRAFCASAGVEFCDPWDVVRVQARSQLFIVSTRDLENYRIAMQDLVYNPGLSLLELVSVESAKRLNLFVKNISEQVRKEIKNPKLRSILEFPVLFLGAKPNKTPAFYNFMNHADFGLGTWYPKGGFNAVALGMVKLAKELGVEFHVNEEVIGIDYENNQAKKIRTQNGVYEADVFISGADYAHTEKLLNGNRNYSEEYWQKKTFAPSSFLYYVAFNRKVNHLLHHNLFFDTDFEAHAKEIYDTKELPKQPLFYANFSSKTDDSLCEEGKEVGFFLIPVAVDLEDNEEIHEKYFQLILDRIKKCTGEDLSDAIVFKKSFGVKDFKERYHSCRGNAYGLANTLLQTSVLRPTIKNKKLKNFFYTGQLTVPGPGVPPALISGKVVTDYILKNN